MHAYLAEFIGTALLILFGNGVVANVVLSGTKGNGGGWIVISAGWGIAVFIGAFCSQAHSGAHINPAVSMAMVLAGELSLLDMVGYVASQMAGAMAGALLVFLFYREHFKLTSNANAQMACFCTSPNVRNLPQALACEVIGTYVLILPIFLMVAPNIELGSFPGPSSISSSISVSEPSGEVPTLGLGTLGLLPVGMLVFGIGLSLGGTTGYAINPARDLGPRIIHAIVPIPGKRDSDWSYAWVPIVGPLVGAGLAALTFRLMMI